MDILKAMPICNVIIIRNIKYLQHSLNNALILALVTCLIFWKALKIVEGKFLREPVKY